MICGSVRAGEALRRTGARPGDVIYVSGPLGRGKWRFEPRITLGRQLRGLGATACMDLSDGLSLDLHRLTVASRVSAALDAVPVARGAKLAEAFHRGEDYELLFTLPARGEAAARCPPRGSGGAGARWPCHLQWRTDISRRP